MRSPTSTIALALLLSIAAHCLLFISDNPIEPPLSHHTIIHARLDKQNRELIQQEQVGQIAQQHNKKISESSKPSEIVLDQALTQEASKAEEKNQPQAVISSQSNREKKALDKPSEDAPAKTTQNNILEELIEKVDVAATQPEIQKSSQLSSDSRAQVEALEGNEDPTYTSYRRVLKQYLSQRLETKAKYQGTVRLKIKLEYGSIATSVNIIESSGNLEIDRWAKTAALAANPYPKIPKEIGSTFEFSPTLQFGKVAP
ncbi:MAG: TonB family protein [Oleispira sp.]